VLSFFIISSGLTGKFFFTVGKAQFVYFLFKFKLVLLYQLGFFDFLAFM